MTSHVRFNGSDVLQIGGLDGAPGPSFIVFDTGRFTFILRPVAKGLQITLPGHLDLIVPGKGERGPSDLGPDPTHQATVRE